MRVYLKENAELMDEVKFIEYPLCPGSRLMQRQISYCKKGDWWYRAQYDLSNGCLLREESSHKLLCGSKFMNFLRFDRGAYRRTEGEIDIHYDSWEYEFSFGSGAWRKRHFTMFGDWQKASISDVQNVVNKIIKYLEKYPLFRDDIEILLRESHQKNFYLAPKKMKGGVEC